MMKGRIRWAVDGLELTGTERVLEVGPGHGVALDYCAGELPDGLVVGLDRSPKMIDASRSRNRDHIEHGRIELVVGTPDGSTAELERFGPFDRILALRVRAFLDQPGSTLVPLVRHLARGARVHLVFDSPTGQGLEEVAERMESIFAEAGLRSGGVTHEANEDFTAVRVVGLAAG